MQRVYPKRLEVRLPDGRRIGTIENGILKRTFKASQHLLRRPPALCIDARTYDAYRKHFYALAFRDSETSRIYFIHARTFEKHRFTLERGYGKQYAVGLRWWSVYDPNAQPTGQLALEL